MNKHEILNSFVRFSIYFNEKCLKDIDFLRK